MAVATCAHTSYLDKHGRPRSPPDLFGHRLIGLDKDRDYIAGAKALGWKLTRESFAYRCDDHAVLWEMAKAGLGIGFAQKSLVEEAPGMEIILQELPLPPLELWLTTHRALRTNARIRKVFDCLDMLFKDYLEKFT